MIFKVHWIVDGLLEVEAETAEQAEAEINAKLQAFIASQPELTGQLGARAIQGQAYLPGEAEAAIGQDLPDGGGHDG